MTGDEGAAFREVPPFQIHSERAEQRLTAAPTNPMAVARDIIGDLFRQGTSVLLRNHRGDFYGYDGTIWPEAEELGIRSQLYKWLELAWYEKETRTGPVMTPWSPTSGKVSNVVDSLKALVHLDGSLDAPVWIDSALDGQGGQADHALFSANDLVVFSNGLLHVPSRTLIPHTPAYFSQNCLPYGFDPSAICPRWLAFLNDLWPEDDQSIATLQEVLGYIIGGDTSLQKIFLIVGPKRSGKGTIARVLTGLLGRHNVAAPPLAGLAANFGLQELITRPLALISDARLSSRGDTSIIVERLLSISGEDTIQVDRKYRAPWNGKLPTRFFILTNELPKLTDSSGALACRFVLLLLTRSFYGQENPQLTSELLEEAPGILNWALTGLDRLTARGRFSMPATSDEMVRQMEDLASPVGAFVRTQCELGSDYRVEVDEIWRVWREWCIDQNRNAGTKSSFGRDLKAVGPMIVQERPRTENEKRAHVYRGIKLLSKTFGSDPDHPDRPDQSRGEADSSGQGGQADRPFFSQQATTSPIEEEVF